MANRKIPAMVPVFFFFFIVLTACTLTTNDGNNSGDNSINIIKVSAKDLIAPVSEQNPVTKNVADGANDFAFSLGAELLKDSGNANFVCSPFSAWLPLAALVNATASPYKDALVSALGASGISETDINRTASRMLYNLTDYQNKNDKDYYNPLKIANAIFVDNNVTLRKDFAQTYMDYFRGSSINVDFSSPSAADAVNRWASQNTNGLIKEIIKEFDPSTVAAIANAIYYADKWSWKFDSDDTKDGIFYSPNGETTAHYMLREGGSQGYYEDDMVQAMPLYFKHGGVLYIILPRAGDASEFLASMTNDYFKEIARNTQRAEGKLLLPRFSIGCDFDSLAKTLTALGIPLFDEASAPLSGGLIEEGIPVYLSSARQKALINVDEEGTTAAAVTVMSAATSTGSPPQPEIPFEMICNRPFVFILCDNTYDGGNQILFTGVVNRP